MNSYKCPRCGYLAKQRTDLRRHFLRKNSCPNKYDDITIEECMRTILFEQKSNSLKNPEKWEKIPENSLKNPENGENSLKNPEKNLTCIYCQKKFTRKDNLKVHVEKFCKKKVLEEENLRKINELQKEIENLKSQKSEKNISINNHNSNNNYSNNNNNNVQNNHITINAFGKENLDYISKELVQKLIKDGPYGGIQKLINNIKIPNKRDKFGMVFNGEKWMMKNKQSMISEIAGNAYDMITDHCQDLTSKRYNMFCDDYENGSGKKRVVTDTELVILNEQTNVGLI
jgi:hypothetical protein